MTFAAAITSPTLNNADDVRAWFDAMLDAGIRFHPEDTFRDMSDTATGALTFTDAEAEAMDAGMERAYELVDNPCTMALEAAWKRL